MRLYQTQVGDNLPRIVRATIKTSSYTSVSLYRAMIVYANSTDDGTYPVIWDWTALKAGTIVRLPD